MWNAWGSSRDYLAWDAYENAVLSGDVDMKQLQAVAASEDHAGAKMQEWAYLGWADRQLRLAADRYLTDRDDANKRLTTISAVYEQFSENAADPEIRNRARLGLARVDEMQDRLDEARKQYALVEGALATVAAERIKALEATDAQETCKWLATAKLPKRPAGGATGARPGFDAAAPSADANPAEANAPRSIEDILSGLTPSKGEPARYSEPDKEGATESTGDAATSNGEKPGEGGAASSPGSAETPATETSAPAPSTPAETPPADATPPATGETPPSQP
jgi:hypothetical protein